MFTAQEGWLVRPSSHANLLAEERRPIRLKGPSPRSSVKFPSCKSWPTHVHPGPPQLPSNQSHLSLPILCPVGNIKFVLLSFNSVQQFLIPKTWESFSSDTGFLIGVGSRSLAWSPDCEGDQSAFFWPPSAWVVPQKTSSGCLIGIGSRSSCSGCSCAWWPGHTFFHQGRFRPHEPAPSSGGFLDCLSVTSDH